MGNIDLLQSDSAAPTREIPLFPLNTVLFPGGLLPLKVFEQRYLDMTKVCIRDGSPFGVCLIKEGSEVGSPAIPYKVGCLARITDWDMPNLGVLHLKTLGSERFRIVDIQTHTDGLLSASALILQDAPAISLPHEYDTCALVLKLIIERLGEERFIPPFMFEDAAWVGYRLSEVLPMKLSARQELLELDDPILRLQALQGYLREQGLEN